MYTIFLGKKLWTNVIDDMNTTQSWGIGGMVWCSKKKALACMKNLKKYDLETSNMKFKIVKLNETRS